MSFFFIFAPRVAVSSAFVGVLYRRQQLHILKSSCKVPDILVQFQPNMYFLERFKKKKSVIKFDYIRLVIRVARWTDRHDEANKRFSRLCGKAPKKVTKVASLKNYKYIAVI
jgi:hypothetical protein